MTRAAASLARECIVRCETTSESVHDGVGFRDRGMPTSSPLSISWTKAKCGITAMKLAIANQLRNRGEAVAVLDDRSDFVTRGQLLDHRAQHVWTTGQYHREIEQLPEPDGSSFCDRALVGTNSIRSSVIISVQATCSNAL